MGRDAPDRETRAVGQRLDELKKGVGQSIRETVAGLASTIEGTRIELLSTGAGFVPDADLERMQIRLEGRIEELARDANTLLEGLADQLSSLMEAVRRGETLSGALLAGIDDGLELDGAAGEKSAKYWEESPSTRDTPRLS